MFGITEGRNGGGSGCSIPFGAGWSRSTAGGMRYAASKEVSEFGGASFFFELGCSGRIQSGPTAPAQLRGGVRRGTTSGSESCLADRVSRESPVPVCCRCRCTPHVGPALGRSVRRRPFPSQCHGHL